VQLGPTGLWEHRESVLLTLDSGGGWWTAHDVEVARLNPGGEAQGSSFRARFGSMVMAVPGHWRGWVLGVLAVRVKT
jgi:hypothetical protein